MEILITYLGYEVKLWYIQPDAGVVSSTVSEGDRLGLHTSLHCSDCYSSTMTDHVHVQLYHNNAVIDPTSRLDC